MTEHAALEQYRLELHAALHESARRGAERHDAVMRLTHIGVSGTGARDSDVGKVARAHRATKRSCGDVVLPHPGIVHGASRRRLRRTLSLRGLVHRQSATER
jgi:hypothetical protein